MSQIDYNEFIYAPYSRQKNWCVVEGRNGLLYPGVRIENASFPLTITASQVAVFSCLSEGIIPSSIYIPNEKTDERMSYLVEFHSLEIKSMGELPRVPIFEGKINSRKSIKENLVELMNRAIVGESNFRVACMLELHNGQYISGINIEYPDWQIGLCAERVALCKAIVFGKIDEIAKIHITASKGSFISPCGACRQVLVEHVPYTSICLNHPDGSESSTTAAQLLPAFFNGSSLRK